MAVCELNEWDLSTKMLIPTRLQYQNLLVFSKYVVIYTIILFWVHIFSQNLIWISRCLEFRHFSPNSSQLATNYDYFNLEISDWIGQNAVSSSFADFSPWHRCSCLYGHVGCHARLLFTPKETFQNIWTHKTSCKYTSCCVIRCKTCFLTVLFAKTKLHR